MKTAVLHRRTVLSEACSPSQAHITAELIGDLLYLASGARDASILFFVLAVPFIIPLPLLCLLCPSNFLGSWIPQTLTADLAGLHGVQVRLSEVSPSPARGCYLPRHCVCVT